MALTDIQYPALKAEITTDPLGFGYLAMSDSAVADKLNEVPPSAESGREIERDVVPTWEVFEATVPSEWTALSAAEKQRYQSILAMGSINLKKPNTRSTFAAMFGAGTTTRANLIALRNEAASRATVLFGERVESWDVARARAL